MSITTIPSVEKEGICCLGCLKPTVELVLDLGPQPPGNLFLKSREQSFPLHPLRFGVCTSCGLAQLIDPMPEELVKCTHDWLRYEEPEQHLDNLAEFLHSVWKTKTPIACGMSYKDATLLDRLKDRGWKLNTPFTETPESVFHSGKGVDVHIARHILEHARNPRQFVNICAEKCRPDGLLVFEVPGFERMLQEHLHCFLWEEHILYFTRSSLEQFLLSCGLEVLEVMEYPLAMENSLVALARPSGAGVSKPLRHREITEDSLTAIRAFGTSLPRCRDEIQAILERLTNSGKVLSMFGAGHLGMKFINFYELAPFLEAVLDDHPQKSGTFLPASLLPITNSSWLAQNPEGVCLVAVNPEKYDMLKKRHPFFTSGRGVWCSIFADFSDFCL